MLRLDEECFKMNNIRMAREKRKAIQRAIEGLRSAIVACCLNSKGHMSEGSEKENKKNDEQCDDPQSTLKVQLEQEIQYLYEELLQLDKEVFHTIHYDLLVVACDKAKSNIQQGKLKEALETLQTQGRKHLHELMHILLKKEAWHINLEVSHLNVDVIDTDHYKSLFYVYNNAISIYQQQRNVKTAFKLLRIDSREHLQNLKQLSDWHVKLKQGKLREYAPETHTFVPYSAQTTSSERLEMKGAQEDQQPQEFEELSDWQLKMQLKLEQGTLQEYDPAKRAFVSCPAQTTSSERLEMKGAQEDQQPQESEEFSDWRMKLQQGTLQAYDPEKRAFVPWSTETASSDEELDEKFSLELQVNNNESSITVDQTVAATETRLQLNAPSYNALESKIPRTTQSTAVKDHKDDQNPEALKSTVVNPEKNQIVPQGTSTASTSLQRLNPKKTRPETSPEKGSPTTKKPKQPNMPITHKNTAFSPKDAKVPQFPNEFTPTGDGIESTQKVSKGETSTSTFVNASTHEEKTKTKKRRHRRRKTAAPTTQKSLTPNNRVPISEQMSVGWNPFSMFNTLANDLKQYKPLLIFLAACSVLSVLVWVCRVLNFAGGDSQSANNEEKDTFTFSM